MNGFDYDWPRDTLLPVLEQQGDLVIGVLVLVVLVAVMLRARQRRRARANDQSE